MQIEIANKYKPLFKLLRDDYKEVDTVIITGGRGSGKSWVVALWSVIALVQYSFNILYTRYTNLSIIDSVKPEISDKVELLGLNAVVTDTITNISYKDSRISFKGIKTGSSQQTANLKGLSGFNVFVCDEAEELPDYKTFKKIFYSIRSNTKRNINILILNPTTKDNWIHKTFFEDMGIEGGHNGIKENVLYIHTSYLDIGVDKLAPNIVADYERMKANNPSEYESIVLGGWVEDKEGVLLQRSQLNFSTIPADAPNIAYRFAIGDPADKGGDKFSTVFVDILTHGNSIKAYIRDVLHNTHGIEANSTRIVDRVNTHNIEHVIFETNGVGLAAYITVKKMLNENKKITAYTSHVDKETRILSNYEFIRDFFIFDEKYRDNPEYNAFMSDLCNYSAEKEGRSENKHRMDAIDVLSAASGVIKLKYKNIL